MRLYTRLVLAQIIIAGAAAGFFPLNMAEGARDPEFKRMLASLGPDSPYSDSAQSATPDMSHKRPDIVYPEVTNFPVPLELRSEVDFWKKIYSKYTTRQAVIHDRDNLGIIYDVVDLDRAFNGRGASYRAERNYIRRQKNHIENILTKLYRNKGKAVTAEEKAIAAKFDLIPGYRKFRDASWRVRAQLGQADRFKEGLRRSGKYLGRMRTIFRSYGLPEELTVLPHVESSFNYDAYSSAGAAGIWQFTRGTGRLFMKIDYTIDERRDPIVATDAAARLLRQNYEELGAWPLAITAYNHGVNGMRRARQKHGADIVKIINHYKSRSFGFASKNFYVEFLAALDVTRNHQKHFGEIEFEPEFAFDEVVMTHYVPASLLSGKLGLPADVLKEYNPALRKIVWNGHRHIPKGLKLRVPGGMSGAVLAALDSLSSEEKFASQKNNGFHVVSRGDTLGIIAQRYKTSITTLKDLNGLRSDTIFAGQRLRIPGGEDASAAKSEDGYHYVRHGESLYLIARRYGTTVSDLSRINNLSSKSIIYPGQRLSLGERNEEAVMVASLAPAPVPATSNDGQEEFSVKPAVFEPQEPARDQEVKTQADGESVTINSRTLHVRAEDFSVRAVNGNVGVITVKAEESLGLYADWLRVSKRHIQRMNRRNLYRNIKIGHEVRIPLTKVSRESFEQKRLEYHMGLMEDFFEAYKIEGEKVVTIASGQSLWDLCVNKHDAPLWLVRLYNPDTSFDSLMPGETITIPMVTKK